MVSFVCRVGASMLSLTCLRALAALAALSPESLSAMASLCWGATSHGSDQ